MQQYKLYFKIIAGVFVLALLAFLCLLFLTPFSLSISQNFLIVASFALAFILSAKFFIFKNPTIAWFALFLFGFCAIIILYYIRVIDDRFWPLFLLLASFSCGVVGFLIKSYLSLNMSLILFVIGAICMLWSFKFVDLGRALILVFLFFITKLICNIVVNALKRRYYGKI